MFQLTKEEFLRCQIGTSSEHGGRRYAPCAFTEQGVAMLSALLDSPRAIQANIAKMRDFVRLRSVLNTIPDTSAPLSPLDSVGIISHIPETLHGKTRGQTRGQNSEPLLILVNNFLFPISRSIISTKPSKRISIAKRQQAWACFQRHTAKAQ